MIGDAHLATDEEFDRFIHEVGTSGYCVGDFSDKPRMWDRLRETDIMVIPGNHDPSRLYDGHPNVIEGMSVFKKKNLLGHELKIMTLSGAKTPDWAKTERYPDEELTQDDLDIAIELYESMAPDVMITHCSPGFMGPAQMEEGFVEDSRTVRAMEEMWKLHQPKYWFFGHYHYFKQFSVGNCQCCALDIWSKITI